MTTHVDCRSCGISIQQTASTCPKCGALQLTGDSAPASTPASASPPMQSTSQTISTYSQVPWCRRRWFLLLCLLTIAPIAAVVALTGDLFYSAKGVVKRFEQNIKTAIYILSLYYLYSLFTPIGSSQQSICFVLSLVLAVVMAVKK